MSTNKAEKKIVKMAPDVWAVSGRKLVQGIERAKQNLAAQFHDKLELPQRLLRAALNEAEALAWETGYPQLVFPTLAEEKIAAFSKWYSWGGILRSDYAVAI